MRIGLFGGSFDPVHYGHLLLAEHCREVAKLDRVLFVPAHIPPHKQGRKLTEGKHRLEMLRLAIGGNPYFDVSDLEICRGGVSFTVDTLRTLQEQNSSAELYLMMGEDTLADLRNWKSPTEILQRSIPLVFRRPKTTSPLKEAVGDMVSPSRLAEFESFEFETPRFDFSSTDLRDRIVGGRSIRYRTPRGVEEYIRTHRLYLLDQ